MVDDNPSVGGLGKEKTENDRRKKKKMMMMVMAYNDHEDDDESARSTGIDRSLMFACGLGPLLTYESIGADGLFAVKGLSEW